MATPPDENSSLPEIRKEESFSDRFIRDTINLFQETVTNAGWSFKVTTERGKEHPSIAEIKAILNKNRWKYSEFFERINKNTTIVFLENLMLSKEIKWGPNLTNTLWIIPREDLHRLEVIGLPRKDESSVKQFIQNIGKAEFISTENTTNILFSKITNEEIFDIEEIKIPTVCGRGWNIKLNWFKIDKTGTRKLTKVKRINKETNEEEFIKVYRKKYNKRKTKPKQTNRQNHQPRNQQVKKGLKKNETLNKPKSFIIDQPHFDENTKTSMYKAKIEYLASLNSTPMQSTSFLGKSSRPKNLGNTPPSAEAKKRKESNDNENEMMEDNEENNEKETTIINEKKLEEIELNPPETSHI